MQTNMIRSSASAAAAPQRSSSPFGSMAEIQATRDEIKLIAEVYGMDERETRHLQRAYFLSTVQSGLVPDAFKGDIRSIYIMSFKAERMGIGLPEVLQGGYFVHGRHGWYAEFMISRVLELKIFTKIDYVKTGSIEDGTRTCIAVGTRPDGSTAEGSEVSLAMAKKEGWTEKKGSKWVTMPDYMLEKRAATFLIRATGAHAFGGSSDTVDEIKEQAEKGTVLDVTPPADARLAMQDIARSEEKKAQEHARFDLLDRIEKKIADMMQSGVQEFQVLTALGLMSLEDIKVLAYQQLIAVWQVLSTYEPEPPAAQSEQPEPDADEQQRLEILEKLKALIRSNKLTNGIILEKTGTPPSVMETAGLSDLLTFYKKLSAHVNGMDK